MSVVIVGVIRRKPVLTHASIVCEGMLASVNSVNSVNRRRRKWTVQWYSPCGASVHSHLIHTSLGPSESKSPQSVPVLYNGPPLASKLPLLMGRSGSPWNTWCLGSTQVLNANGIAVGSAVIIRFTTVTDRPTDRPSYSVGNNRPHLCT